MPSLGIAELVIILMIVVLLFGATRLGKLGKGLGEGIKNFKDSVGSSSEAEENQGDENKA